MDALGQYDVFTTCPALYTVGQLTPISCTINSTKVDAAQCSLPADTVQLYLTKKGSISSACSTTYPPSTCTPARSGKKCGCVKQEGDIFTFVFEFMPNSADKSEKLRCEVDCLDAHNLTQEPACAPITFIQTTTQSEQSTPGTAGETGSLSTGQIVGIVVGVIAAVCVAAGMQFSMYSVIACLRYVSNVNGICHVQVCNLVCIL